jgi:hypothetical protein
MITKTDGYTKGEVYFERVLDEKSKRRETSNHTK